MKNSLEEDKEFRSTFGMSLPGRMGSKVRPWGRDWEQTMPMPDAKNCQAMKGDSISTAINSSFFDRMDSSNRTESTRNNPNKKRKVKKGEVLPWEYLNYAPMPSKTRDSVVTHIRESCNEDGPDLSHD